MNTLGFGGKPWVSPTRIEPVLTPYLPRINPVFKYGVQAPPNSFILKQILADLIWNKSG